jgi:hypothetical protein
VVNVATAAIVLPLQLVHDRGDVWLIYAVMAAYGTSNAVMGAAQPALLRTLVPEALLPEANGTLQTVREGLRLVAPLAGAGHALAGPQVASIAGGAALVATLDFRLVLAAMAVLLTAATLPLLNPPGGAPRSARPSPAARRPRGAPPRPRAG